MAIIKALDPVTNEVTEIDTVKNTRTMRDPSTGHLVTMDLGQSDVHIDKALSNIAFGFKLEGGVADLVSPVIPVANASDKYYTWDKDDVFQQAANPVVSAGGAIAELSPRLSNSAFATISYALQALVPVEVEANADSPLRPRAAATRRLVNALTLAREYRVASLLTTAGSYGAAYKATIASGAKWNGGATSDPVQDILTRIEASLQPITDIVMSRRTFNAFATNAAVQKYVAAKVNASGLPSTAEFSALLRLPPIHVVDIKGKSNSAGTYGYVWGNDVVLLHRPQAGVPADGQDIATSYTFRWNEGNALSDGTALPGGFFVRSYFDPRKGPRGSTVIVVGHNDAEVLVSDVVSGLISSAYQ
jgi:hypothetical protein